VDHKFVNLIKFFRRHSVDFSTFSISSIVGGPLNPKKPSQALCVQLFLLQKLGLWAPDDSPSKLYTIWSFINRFLFLHLYTLTEILYFTRVERLTVSLLCIIMSLLHFHKSGAIDCGSLINGIQKMRSSRGLGKLLIDAYGRWINFFIPVYRWMYLQQQQAEPISIHMILLELNIPK